MNEAVKLIQYYINEKQYKNVFIIRNGEFVGLYRFSFKLMVFKLWRKINSKKYGCRSSIPLRSIYQMKGRSHDWLSDYIYANETYPIPDGYNIDDKEHLLVLDGCLGFGSGKVTNRIRERQPLWKKCGHNRTYAE